MRLLITGGGTLENDRSLRWSLGSAIAKEALIDRHQVTMVRSACCQSPFAKTVDNLASTKWDAYLNELVEHWNWCERYRKQYKEFVFSNQTEYANMVFAHALGREPDMIIFADEMEGTLSEKRWKNAVQRGEMAKLRRILVCSDLIHYGGEEDKFSLTLEKRDLPLGQDESITSIMDLDTDLGTVDELVKGIIYSLCNQVQTA